MPFKSLLQSWDSVARIGGVRPKSQASVPFTYKVDRLVEPGADVGLVVVLHGDALVLIVTLKMVGTIG